MLKLKELLNNSLKIKRNKHLAKEIFNDNETFRRNQGNLYLVNYHFLSSPKMYFLVEFQRLMTQNLSVYFSKTHHSYEEKNKKSFSPCSSSSEFMMKTQLFGSSWCITAIHFATFITSCKPANTTTLENMINVNKTIKFCISVIRQPQILCGNLKKFILYSFKCFNAPCNGSKSCGEE